MGAFVSVSGHPSHPEHNACYTRFVSNHAPPSRCRICQLNFKIGAPAYRCSEPGGCAVVLHEACYDRRPKTPRRHLGHPQRHLRRRRVATTGQAAPWSYQCPNCDAVEYCLACCLREDDPADVRCCCFQFQCCSVEPAVVDCLGRLGGVFFRAFFSGMGCPCPAGIQTQPYHGDIEITRHPK